MRELQLPGVHGMNQDVLDSRLSKEVRLLHNGRSFRSNDGRDGTVRNIPGTVIGMDDANFSVDARVIGSAKYSEHNSILVFIYDTGSAYGNSIIEYLPETNTYTFILTERTPPVLNFSPAHIIRGAYVIDGKLYWNDAYNSPRKININKAMLFFYTAGGSADGYSIVDKQTIELIKYPPLYRMEPVYRKVTINNPRTGIGTVSNVAVGTIITGTGTLFTTTFNVGDSITIGTQTVVISAIASDTSMTTASITDANTDVGYTAWRPYNDNRLRGKLFQFKYAYIYGDYEHSVPSQVSKVAIPVNEMEYSGEILGDLQQNNCINFYINLGHSTVKKIIIYAREGNIGLWGEVETLDRKDIIGIKGDFSDYLYSFFNDRVIEITDQVKVDEPYHAVPLLSDELGYIHSNQILLAGNTEGYDNLPTIDVILTPVLSEPVIPVSPGTNVLNWPSYLTGAGTSFPTFPQGALVDFSGVAATINDVIIISLGGKDFQFLVTSLQVDIPTLCNAVADAINANWQYPISNSYGAEAYINQTTSPINYVLVTNLDPNGDGTVGIVIEEWTNAGDVFSATTGFKSGAQQAFGLIYYDEAGRSNFVQKIPTIYCPSLPEVKAAGGTPVQNSNYFFKWSVNHFPPVWAVKYQFCRQPTPTMIYFRDYIINGITNGDANFPDKSLVDISPLNLHRVQYNGLDYSFPNSSIEAYSWEKGDRVRFLTASKTVFTTTQGLGDVLPYSVDMEILGYQLSTPPAISTDPPQVATNMLILQQIDLATYTELGENTLIEIYRPKITQQDLSYYETGELFDIGTDANGHKYHKGTVDQVLNVDGTSNTPATGLFTQGDVYMVPTVFSKNMGTTTATPYINVIESASASNFYDLKVYNIGRPNIPNENAKQKKTLSIRASDAYFENTQVNGLSAFYAGKDLFVSAQYGQDVIGLNEVGFSLKVLQPRKITTFFVGRQGLQISSDATNQIQATSADVLSTKTPSQEMFGSINPESVLAVNRNLYFADIRNGAILRDAPNGMEDITVYGLHSTFQNLFTTLKGMDSNRIMASFNPLTKEVGFTFVGITAGVETDLGTYYFNEELNKWNSKWDYKEGLLCPMGFADINQSYISFVGKKIWLHEKGARNLIYGNQLPITIDMVFNANAGNSKLYKTLEIEGIGTWSCPNEGDVLIEAKNSNIKRDQKSRLVAGKFKNVKGVMIAPFMKDMNTQNGTAPIFNLMNGHDLRGNILSLRLINSDTTEAVLDTVVVTSQLLGI